MNGLARRRRLSLLLGSGRVPAVVAAVLMAATPVLIGASVSTASTQQPTDPTAAVVDGVGGRTSEEPPPCPEGAGGAPSGSEPSDPPPGEEPPPGECMTIMSVAPSLSATPNPTPAGGTVSFSWSVPQPDDCWDSLGHAAFTHFFSFQMSVSESFTWTVWCGPSSLSSSLAIVVGANPIGWFDQVDAGGSAAGWTCDADNYGAALQVDFYADGPPGSGTPAGSATANLQREPAVAANCGGNAYHGFAFSVPASLRNGQQHTLYAYALNVGGGSNVLLGGSPQSFLLWTAPLLVSAPTISPSAGVHPGDELTTTTGSWSGTVTDYSFAWLRDGVPITGAGAESYTVTAADVGATIRSRVTACAPPCTVAESSNAVVPEESSAPPEEQSYGTTEDGIGRHGLSATGSFADPVNSRTGAFTTAVGDLDLPGTGVSFAWSRSYTSADETVGRLGPGWTDSYSTSLVFQDGDAVLHGEDGQQLLFEDAGSGSFAGASGSASTLAAVAGGYELVRPDQVVYRFDTAGRLLSVQDRHGLGVTLGCDGQNRLQTITDAANRQATISYNASNLVSQVSTQDGRSVAYGYAAGRLTSVTDVRGKPWTYSYDAGGRLASIVDPLGHAQVTNVYGANGRVVSQTDALGEETTFAWYAATETATATDANANAWTHDYADGLLGSEIDPLANDTDLVPDADLNTTEVTSPTGEMTAMTYDPAGNLLTITAPPSLGGVQKRFEYNARNDVELVTDARGKVTDYVYNGATGTLTSVTQDEVQVGGYTYDAQGRVETFTDGNEKTWTYTYFPATGYLKSSLDPLGNETTYTYDAAGRVLTRVDPKGNVEGCNCAADFTWTYTYDAAGNQLTEANPLGQQTSNVYDDAGRLASTSDALGRTTSYTYDDANRVLTETAPDPDGAGPLAAPVTTSTYDAVGNKLTETDPRGNTTTFDYDEANRLVSTAGPDPDGAGPQTPPLTTHTYDANGNLASTVEPRGNVQGANPDEYRTTFTYDAAGRMLMETRPDPDGVGPALPSKTTNTYDAVSNLATVEDGNDHLTSYSYDAAGRILTVTGPDGGLTTYTYDDAGSMLTRRDDNNHTTTFAYDNAGRLESETSPDPDGPGPQGPAVTTYAFDPNGNRETLTDPNGNATPATDDGVTTYGYDRANRQTSIVYSDSTPDVAFGYDGAGNRLTMTDGSDIEVRSYDNLDRVLSVTRGSNTFSYVYDAASNVTRRTYPGNTVADYTYDPLNRPASVRSSSQTTSYAYDVASNLTQTTLPSGNGYVETRVYDRSGRLTEVKNQRGSTILSRFLSTLDPVGNPTQVVRTGGLTETQTYTYDENDRIKSVCFQAGACPGASDPFIRWTYDKVGSRLSEQRPTGTTTYAYDARDRLLSAGSTTFAYDQNGNQLQKGSRTFTYDLENRLKTTTQGSTTTTYLYDGDGTRLRASTGSSSSQITNFLWDTSFGLPQLARETNGSNSLLRRYLYGERRISLTNSSNTTYYHYDPLGSVSNMTSSSGSTRWTYSYEPFGTLRTETSSGTPPTNLMKFTGEYLDPTSLYHLRARQYDPGSGRFMRTDPVPLDLDTAYITSYGYAANRPTVFVDPSGEVFRPADEGQSRAMHASSSVEAIFGPNCMPGSGGGGRYTVRITVPACGPGGGARGSGPTKPPKTSRPDNQARAATAARSGEIMPYHKARELTAGLGHKYQAHKLLERRHLIRWKESIDDAPAVVMSRSRHQMWTNRLHAAMPTGRGYTRREVRGHLRTIYRADPAWLRAVLGTSSNERCRNGRIQLPWGPVGRAPQPPSRLWVGRLRCAGSGSAGGSRSEA